MEFRLFSSVRVAYFSCVSNSPVSRFGSTLSGGRLPNLQNMIKQYYSLSRLLFPGLKVGRWDVISPVVFRLVFSLQTIVPLVGTHYALTVPSIIFEREHQSSTVILQVP